eukprot:gnl/Spiro4/14937_TR8050_c0_g1_i1.p1 gnl/Spiro4/14937_TR8050_c0_g1~~gnl/Spiro4/14937_TR8050_c0_g1_i1.p1  ORF type:complete len:144 (+),score=36.63 gnl/Spiro4/14937_TR8050_c0_g1_i1:36-434(+)
MYPSSFATHATMGGAASAALLPPPTPTGVIRAENATMFPLMVPLDETDFNALPEYLKTQLARAKLNKYIDTINDYVTDKRFSDDEDANYITKEELQTNLSLGNAVSSILLALLLSKRLATDRKGYRVRSATL